MNKDEFKAKAKKSIDDIYAKIDEMEGKRDQLSAEAKAKYHERVNQLKEKRNELEAQIKELEGVSEEKWEDAKKRFSSSIDSFKEGFSRLGDVFK